MWIQDKFRNFKQANILQDINLDFETNSVRFRVQAYGFLYGYVVGKFNNWEKKDQYKLSWLSDTDDGSLWLTIVECIPNLTPGINEYSFILVDLDGNEYRISTSNKGFEPLNFNWRINSDYLEIKSSENFIVPGFALDLVAIMRTVTDYRKVVDVEWKVFPKSVNIEITDNQLVVDPSEKGIFEVFIECSSVDNPSLTAQRKFKVIKENRSGNLIHFIKKDKNYRGENFCWDLWGFDNGQSPQSIEFSRQSDFGLMAFCNKKNVIARKKVWDPFWHNDWYEQTSSFSLPKKCRNYYIVYGDQAISTSLVEVINKTNIRIKYAVMDEADKIIAYLSDTPMIGMKFELWINSVKIDNVNLVIKYKSKKLIFTNLPLDIKSYDLIEIRCNSIMLPAKVLMRNYLNRFYYSKNDMGIKFNQEIVSFRIWAPTAKKTELLIYDEDSDNNTFEPDLCYSLSMEAGYGTYYISLKRTICENKFYLYRLYFYDLNSSGEQYTKITYAVDPYAFGLGLNGNKGFIVDLNNDEVKPKGWQDDSTLEFTGREDAIIYETHLRDFTISSESGVAEELRGKFLGAVETGTSYINEEAKQQVSTGLDSLVELGITHIHLLPIFDFSSVDEAKHEEEDNRNWGYDPKNYNAPDGSYSINPYDPKQRITGTRSMILGFHQKGVGVVMDMVYNHMTDTSNLDKIVPKYYFRTDELGNFTNGSGCGNELATERPMVSKFIQDSVVHWVRDYKIDGIRFDLMELIDLDTIKNIVTKIHAINPSIIMYGEPWKAADSPLRNGTYRGTQRNQAFSIFNDFFRDAIRGNNNPGNGLVNGDPYNPANIGKVIEGLKGSIHGLTANPGESVNYVDAHDNYTLWDHIEKSQNHSIQAGSYRQDISGKIFENRLVRQNALALSIILTAQGIPFIHGGVEFLRTKQGDHNSYKSDDITNAFHWSDKLQFKPFFDYIKGLIQLRKEHPALRMRKPEIIKKHLDITTAHHDIRSGVIISHFKKHANGDSWEDILIIYNATTIDNYEINSFVPRPGNDTWYIVANHEQAGVETIEEVKVGNLPVLRSCSILIAHS